MKIVDVFGQFLIQGWGDGVGLGWNIWYKEEGCIGVYFMVVCQYIGFLLMENFNVALVFWMLYQQLVVVEVKLVVIGVAVGLVFVVFLILRVGSEVQVFMYIYLGGKVVEVIWVEVGIK